MDAPQIWGMRGLEAAGNCGLAINASFPSEISCRVRRLARVKAPWHTHRWALLGGLTPRPMDAPQASGIGGLEATEIPRRAHKPGCPKESSCRVRSRGRECARRRLARARSLRKVR